jgi:hypothetical protein
MPNMTVKDAAPSVVSAGASCKLQLRKVPHKMPRQPLKNKLPHKNKMPLQPLKNKLPHKKGPRLRQHKRPHP